MKEIFKKWWFLVLIILVFIFVFIFFFPKYGGEGGSCYGCDNTECECFGFQKYGGSFSGWISTCYGIPYDCKTDVFDPLSYNFTD